MRLTSYLSAAVLMSAAVSSCTTTPEKAMTENLALKAAVESPVRTTVNKQRDNWRNPKETLEFFGIQPNMTVVEVWPGGGWYTEILAPYLLKDGKYVAAGFSATSERSYFRKASERFKKMVASRSEFGSGMKITEFEPPVKTEIIEAGTADAIVAFRNIHNWMGNDGAESAFASFYKALKPGGVLGIVQHRAATNKPQDPKAKSGYVRQDYVINLAKGAGFTFVASSEINANPKDTADHEKGVWTLPPRLALKDKDRAKYVAIGESDRMTLKFMKPKS